MWQRVWIEYGKIECRKKGRKAVGKTSEAWNPRKTRDFGVEKWFSGGKPSRSAVALGKSFDLIGCSPHGDLRIKS